MPQISTNHRGFSVTKTRGIIIRKMLCSSVDQLVIDKHSNIALFEWTGIRGTTVENAVLILREIVKDYIGQQRLYNSKMI